MTAAPVPDVLTLGREGRLYLLSWLHGDVVAGTPIDAAVWRDAWGRAADYQTVCNALRVLAEVTA